MRRDRNDPADWVEDCPQCGRERVYGYDDDEHVTCDNATDNTMEG